jgi:HD-like signal output (HDOD) protein
MPIRVLFVDDEKRVLDGLRRSLRPYRDRLEGAFANGPEQALEILRDAERFDAIVSDMRMPGMDGAQLLDRVRRDHPWMVRIVLSGHSEIDMVLRAVGTSHQYLTKPCQPDSLVDTVTTACRLQTLLSDEHLLRIAGRMSTIPSHTELHQRLVAALRDPDVDIQDVADLIAQDPGMTAQLLRLVNSAYFGLCSEVSDPKRAVNLLGLSTISTLVLTLQIFRTFDDEAIQDAGLGGVWSHGLKTARCASDIARRETSDQLVIDESFSAGLLHDTGRLVLAINEPRAYGQAMEDSGGRQIGLTAAEERHVGVSHALFGAYLMNLWGLPASVVEAIAFHHRPQPSTGPDLRPLVAVHVANAFCSQLAPTGWYDPEDALDLEFLESVGLADRVEAWEGLCREALELEGAAP